MNKKRVKYSFYLLEELVNQKIVKYLKKFKFKFYNFKDL